MASSYHGSWVIVSHQLVSGEGNLCLIGHSRGKDACAKDCCEVSHGSKCEPFGIVKAVGCLATDWLLYVRSPGVPMSSTRGRRAWVLDDVDGILNLA